MATQAARCFPHAGDLKTISPKRLVQLLSPHAEFLSSRGLDLSKIGSSVNPVDYASLMHLLMASEPNTPVELVDSLQLIHEAATPARMNSLLEEAAALGVPLDDPDLSPADLAVLIWLHDSRALERARAEQYLVKPCTFVYFQAGNHEDTRFVEPSERTIRALEKELAGWFGSRQQGRRCRVHVYYRDDGVWFVVWHGAPFRREGCIVHGESSCVCYRPERYDILVYHPATCELQIDACTRQDREVYRRLFGRHIFGDENHFPGTDKYTLDPLRTDGERALVCSDVPGMERVKLYRVEYCIDGSIRMLDTIEADDVFAAERAHDIVIPLKARLRGAWFRIKFADSKYPRAVSLRPSNMIHYERESDCFIVDVWLRLRGFILGSHIILPLLFLCYTLFGLDGLIGFELGSLCASCGMA